eukprot:Sdes_comp18344_c0_seq1m8089
MDSSPHEIHERVSFTPLIINDNPLGWGPCSVPEQFKDIPYQPFSKSDRIGKVSDWTGGTYQDRRYVNRYAQYGSGGNVFSYFHEEDENSFHLVDNRPLTKVKFQTGYKKFNNQKLNPRAGNYNRDVVNNNRLQKNTIKRGGGKSFGSHRKYDNRAQPRPVREASVEPKSDWVVEDEVEFSRLGKLSFEVDDGTDLKQCGSLEYYDKSYDRITTKNERPLQQINRVIPRVTTSDDPILQQFAEEGVGNVFATDSILATIMACPRSVYSWDIVVTKTENQIFFDKRDDSHFDFLTVNETALEPPSEEADPINRPGNLSLEATYVNQNFTQQVLKQSEEKYEFPEPNPFDSTEEDIAPVGYRYRQWNLGDGLVLIARCELDAVMKTQTGADAFMSIKALHEYDPKVSNVDWRQKLDSQKGAVLATELKNNSNKLAKWTAQALLSGADILKLGYVSRVHPRDSKKHSILGTQFYKPKEFAFQINLNISNAWGVLRTIVDLIGKKPNGRYVILKNPNAPVLQIFSVPFNAFDEEPASDDDKDEFPDDEPAEI